MTFLAPVSESEQAYNEVIVHPVENDRILARKRLVPKLESLHQALCPTHIQHPLASSVVNILYLI